MRNGGRKGLRVELGLAVSRLSMKPGQTRTQPELAAFCGVSHAAIQHIEYRALRKVRMALEKMDITEAKQR